MSESDKIKELETQLQQLGEEIKSMQVRFDYLRQQVWQLQNKNSPAGNPVLKPTSIAPPSFSFENFIGLRLIHVVGIVVLVIGLSIGVKYAIDKELISEAARIGLAYAAGGILYLLSWRLKAKYTSFSAILFSGAMASLYFTSYAAFVYYGLFSSAVAFVLMLLLTLFAVYNALQYNHQEIALLSLVGAYGIPFLISSNTGRVELFFAYITIINTAVVFLSYKKRWKTVAFIGQIITWILFLGWAMTKFTAPQQWVGIVFSLLFFLLFYFDAVANKWLRSEAFTRTETQQIIINNAALYGSAILIFAPDLSSGVGWVSLSYGVFLFLQAGAIYYTAPKEAYLKKVLFILSFFLLLLFIAIRWDGLIVTFLWLLMAIILFVWGVITKAVWLRLSAMVLIGITLLKLVVLDSLRFNTVQKIVSYISLGILLLVVSFFYQKFKQKLFEENP